jgi:hypothetical protein
MQKRLAILIEAGNFGRFDCKACGRYFSEAAGEWRAAGFGV